MHQTIIGNETLLQMEMAGDYPDILVGCTGCGNCRETGYRGRIGVHELLIINDRVKNVIMTNSDSQAIKQKAVVEGMKTLKMDGTDKALKGFTTAEEVLTVTYEDESEGFSFS